MSRRPFFRFAGDALIVLSFVSAFFIVVAIFLFIKGEGHPWWALEVALGIEVWIWVVCFVLYRLHVRGVF